MFGKGSLKRSAQDLRAKFEKLGVPDVDFHIKEEASEKSNPRLAPLVMFQEVWKAVLRRKGTGWIANTIEHFERRKGLTGIAAAMWPRDDAYEAALLAVRDSGIDLEHINIIARRAQLHLLHHFAYTLSDSHSDETLFKDVYWAAFETDENGKPLRKMNCLHEIYGDVEPDRVDG